ncbi:MAG: flagellar basal body P-ring formation protein FlgA, partial [Candidatus Latescibacteria bacterium]|nr:flagellar basal body P-ring formation protein FlgA [Candidatus Latescibacterota bacterium]
QRATVKREELIGKRMTKTVGIGRIVSRKDVEERPIIIRGSRVTILAEMGGLTVQATGKALEDGWRGKRIKVRNEASKKRLVAEVVDERTVRTAF